MTEISEQQSPYLEFDADEWAQFRADTPLTLTEEEVVRLRALNDPVALDEVRRIMRERNMAYSTEKTYVHWIRSYVRFHRNRHPRELGAPEVDRYLSWLAVQRNVSPGTQAIALNALVFLYHKCLEIDLGKLDFERPKPRRRVPQVLTHAEATDIISRISTSVSASLIIRLIYGSGLRVISTDVDEVLALADRRLALVRGRIVPVPADADRAALGAILLGERAA